MNEQNDTVKDDELAAKAKALFDASVDGLDGQTLSQLNRNRHEALEQAAGRRTIAWTQWVPATGVAAAAVVAVAVWNSEPSLAPSDAPSTASDFEIILEVDDLEMLEELEFYSWIELEDEMASHVG